MLIYLLLIIFLALVYAVYRIFDKDCVCPAFLLVAGYLLCVACATANASAWGINLHWATVGVFVYGTGLFVGTSYLMKNYIQKKYATVGQIVGLTVITYNKKRVHWFCIFQLAVIAFYLLNIFYITSSFGDYSSFAERMVAFRQWNSYSTQWTGNIIYNLANQLTLVSIIASFVAIYILINNLLQNNILTILKEDKYLFTVVLFSVIQILVTASRLNIIGMVLGTIALAGMLYKQQTGRVYEMNTRKFLLLFVVLIFGAVTFYLSKVIVGRGADVSFSEFLPYITMYAGGPVQLLDMFLQNPVPPSDIWGKETFYAMNLFLSRLHIVDFSPYISHLEFRTAVTGVSLGNIYTAYRSYLYDFGFAGLTVLPVLFAACISALYYSKYYRGVKRPVDWLVIIYAISALWTFMDFARCLFYNIFVSMSFVKQVLIIILVAYWFFGVKLFDSKAFVKFIKSGF